MSTVLDKLLKHITRGVAPKAFHQHRYRLHNFTGDGTSRTEAEIRDLANKQRQRRKAREQRRREQNYRPTTWAIESMSGAEASYWQKKEKQFEPQERETQQ